MAKQKFYKNDKLYTISLLPGRTEDVNASILGGFNININKNISNERIRAAIEVIKYLSSERFQKEIIIKQLNFFSFVKKLYDDKETCQYVNCNIMKEIQFYVRPSSTIRNENFSDRAVKLFHRFLDGEKTAEEVLNEIEDIIKIYYFTMKSTVGAIIMSILVLTFFIVILSTIMVFIPKLKNEYFKFLSVDLWIVYAMGSVFMLISIFEFYDVQTKEKCLNIRCDKNSKSTSISSHISKNSKSKQSKISESSSSYILNLHNATTQYT
ncbi:hypothetical protein PIROE2DRAFT_16688 [Piromyces sp. E2]|nr:hypothetical protein PIROE2DRAFT_16688 [Piromyces sp. E2]|eukprot:OUM58126.1 hypothetical protein PIROE2DRAFT_16688 [Piromyces sp. E2]